jgi:stringent starvation protein B
MIVSETSTKPYLIRAIHEWCSDNGLTPYLAVAVDHRTEVPMEYVKAGEIVLNVSLGATNRLALGNELISFQARFGGVAREISVPIDCISAIYARENGHGMAFDVPKAMANPDVGPDVGPNVASLPAPGTTAGSPFSLVNSRASEKAEESTPTQAPMIGSIDAHTGTPSDDTPSGGSSRPGRAHLTRIK